ncbi:hypothetical protein SASPL_148681 [Salvia splendens]|uniref:Phospholipase A1 n=1 Tax=Salvia splendens TaxID=180675 RepID=A0A8X8WAD4_SALSN|nr:hypothetical protein SASPL_148681 [Salvia splendens]
MAMEGLSLQRDMLKAKGELGKNGASIHTPFPLLSLPWIGIGGGDDDRSGLRAEFELKVKRSLALVNKSSEYLKDELLIPSIWWVEKNKGLVRDDDGEWVPTPPADEDQPVPEFP